jgi:hypothetical protein
VHGKSRLIQASTNPEWNCERSSERVTIVCKEAQNQWEQRKWYIGWALKKASCMLDEDRSGEKLYICLVKRQGRNSRSKRHQKRPNSLPVGQTT